MMRRSPSRNLAKRLHEWFAGAVEIGILGPLEVRTEGAPVSVGGPKQRALLATLALHAGEVVSRDRLIEALWGERPPPSVNESLDVYISRLRRILGRDVVERRGRGYVLLRDGIDLDLDRFEHLLRLAQ